ncbi:unnamed protein product, partial [Polarella glacialis]
ATRIATNATDWYASQSGGYEPKNAACSQTAKCCHDCMACGDETCMTKYPGCDEYLADVYESCEEDADYTALIVIAVVLPTLCLLGAGAWFAFKYYQKGQVMAVLDNLVGDKGNLPLTLSLSGTYTENGETQPCNYEWSVNFDGSIKGRGWDDDGVATVEGRVNLPLSKVLWVETRSGACMTVQGSIRHNGGVVNVQAGYRSTDSNTQGSMNLSSGNAFAAPQAIGQVVQGQVVSGTVMNPRK